MDVDEEIQEELAEYGVLDDTSASVLADLIETIFHRFVRAIWSIPFFVMRVFVPRDLRGLCVAPDAAGQQQQLLHEPHDLETHGVRMTAIIEFLLFSWGDRIRPVTLVLKSPSKVCFSLCHFLLIWLLSRRYHRLTPALPAILCAIIVAATLFMGSLRTSEHLTRHYRETAAKALENDDIWTAELCYQKLRLLEPNDDHLQFEAAEFLAKDGNWEEAYQSMRTLAPKSGLGYVPAHLWIAHALSANRITSEEQDNAELIQFHLNRVLQRHPGNEMANRLLAEQQAKSGATETAIATLRQMAPSDGETELDRKMQIAEILWASGDRALARQLWGEAVSGFESLYTKNGQMVSPRSFKNWAYANLKIEEPTKAIRTLQLGIEQIPTNTELAEAYQTECAAYLKRVGQPNPFNIQGHFETLKRLFASNPDSEFVLLQIADAHGFPSLSHEAEKLLSTRRSDNELPLIVRERLASVALAKNNYDTAKRLYRQILQQDSERPESLNNLAWILANGATPDCEYALSLIDRAISITPKAMTFRGTRGHILVKLKRWEEAITELEVALSGDPIHAQLHQKALALAHRQLGNKELAEIYEGQRLFADASIGR